MSLRFPTLTVRSRLTVLSLIALVMAACSSPGSSSAPESESAAPADSVAPAESTAAGDDASVLVAESDLGQILTDADGNTIYYFANDSAGTSTCADDCLANWPPVPAEGTPTPGDGVTAELGTTQATDGTTMLTVNGFPAYYYAGDTAAGDTNGQAVGDVWWVFGADGEPIEG